MARMFEVSKTLGASALLLVVGALAYMPAEFSVTQTLRYIEESPLADYPLERTVLLFGGDVMLSRNIGQLMEERGDWHYPFALIADTLRDADIMVVNLEGPISLRGKNVGSQYSFRADPRAGEALRFAGVDVVSLANNHMYDWGPEALLDTLALLDDVGIAHAGAGRDYAEAHAPAIIISNGIRFAFLSYTNLVPRSLTTVSSTPAIAWADPGVIAEDIRAARSGGADAVIVLLHFGEEYELKHNAFQESLAKSVIDAGAALVVGHHPHVPQEIERYGSGYIAYSLGNLVFDQNFRDTKQGLLLRAEIKNGEVVNVTPIPIAFNETYQPYVVE
jgi:poly-gamma-glutamate synthesis protein (capsule biosynthesis protein)